MTYKIQKIVTTYTLRGDFKSATKSIIYESDDLKKVMVFRRVNRLKTTFQNKTQSTSYATIDHNGNEIFFSEMFLILEGQDAYDDVMEDRAPAQSFDAYVDAMIAAESDDLVEAV